MTAKRAAAAASLGLLIAAVALAVALAVDQFPAGLVVLACLIAGLAAAWWGLVRSGPGRLLGFGLAVVALIAAVVLVVVQGQLLGQALVVVAILLALGAGRSAFATRAELMPAQPPRRPVLFYNPKSGGGKATRFRLVEEARKRGIEPIELTPGTDLEMLARSAVAAGADALGMAGGDGSQAVVAAVAAEEGLPYVCVPAGTRNHFALDLGVDRDDVVGALDAYVEGRERVVDLAEVNGRVFVNNVSLGVYAEAVQKKEYRGAKIRTLVDTVPTLMGPGGHGLDLEWTDERGEPHNSADVIMVSNDPYRLGRALASGTRPSLERGVLGVAAVGAEGNPRAQFSEWAAPSFDIASGRPVAAGIDGEAVTLEPPLHFAARPRALRVRIAPQHPGASPSAAMPAGPWGALRGLFGIAIRGHP
jgi:diacylglycerol kinase family enzyme